MTAQHPIASDGASGIMRGGPFEALIGNGSFRRVAWREAPAPVS
jgi:hypothetical protein